mgnify:CR=1 FL=1
MIVAIIAAAGAGKRMNSEKNKVFLSLAGVPILCRSCKAVADSGEVDKLVIAASPDEVNEVAALLTENPPGIPWQVVPGGKERQYSIANALKAVPPEAEIILVHDGARPLLQPQAVSQVITAVREWGAAGIAVPVKDTIKAVDEGQFAVSTPPRQGLWAIQTPQGFRAALLRQAYREAEADGFLGTDDASLAERLGIKVKLVTGSYSNIKITTPDDLVIGGALLAGQCRKGEKAMRVGTGYDVHRLVPGRKLILGGVEVPHTVGLDGHSDADVLLHAIKDALLGAAALGDIGRHFPDTDKQYQGISSLLLLKKVGRLVAEQGYRVHNIDATIIAEKPKLAPYIDQMNRNIAAALEIDCSQVNVKATTTERLGFTGRQEGIAAQAAATIQYSS